MNATETMDLNTAVRVLALEAPAAAKHGPSLLGRAALVALEHLPPLGLPAVLSSADDIARVCEAAGLGGYTRVIGGITVGRWGVEQTELVVLTADGEVLVWSTTVAGRPVIIPLGQSSAVLWSAIRAARGEA